MISLPLPARATRGMAGLTAGCAHARPAQAYRVEAFTIVIEDETQVWKDFAAIYAASPRVWMGDTAHCRGYWIPSERVMVVRRGFDGGWDEAVAGHELRHAAVGEFHAEAR